jgi:tryptophan 7-halogenase
MEQVNRIQSVLVLGGGSAGLLAALTLKRRLPKLAVTMVRSSSLGVIGVGEGSTAILPTHLFNNLGIPADRFYREARPTWKQGILFLWGRRSQGYFYDFGFQYDAKAQGTSRAAGFFAWDNCEDLNPTCAMMRRGLAFRSGPLGKPVIKGEYAFHIENALLVSCLEKLALESGILIEDDLLNQVQCSDQHVQALHFHSGKRREADLYIDASGFRSELLGQAFATPFKSFSDALFCDRAVVGGWRRAEDEPILAYTTAETMDAGWSWQIEHEHLINRGYVYSSAFIDDDQAQAEFLRANPKIRDTRVVPFRSGRLATEWVGNAVAVGNAAGFVEPLEATALAQIIYTSCSIVQALEASEFSPGPIHRNRHNFAMARAWDEIRDFLAFHYRFNNRRDTPFWRHCQESTPLGDFEPLFEAYRKLGPSPELIEALPFRPNLYGIEGYLAHLVGMQVPHQVRFRPAPEELSAWQNFRQRNASAATTAVSVGEALQAIRAPSWSFCKVSDAVESGPRGQTASSWA